MKYIQWFRLCLFFGLAACHSEMEEEKLRLEIDFEQHWNNSPITPTTLNAYSFENAAGELLSIERLRYLISDLSLGLKDGSQVILKAYHLIDIKSAESLRLSLETYAPLADIQEVSFVFGLNRLANQDGAYPDLNAAVWNVPQALGGGYHFMQLDGKFKAQPTAEAIAYNFHAIQAVDKTAGTALVFEDTFFKVSQQISPQTADQDLTISMNLAEWFVNPHLWYLEKDNSMLMPNFEAQQRMADNGKSVFSIVVKKN